MMKHHLASWVALGSLLASCSAGDSSEDETRDSSVDESAHALSPGLEMCSALRLSSRSITSACAASELGSIAFEPASMGSLPRGLAWGRALDVHLTSKDESGQNYAVLSYHGSAQRHAFYSGSPHVPLSLKDANDVEQLDCGKYLNEELAVGLTGSDCAPLKEVVSTAVLEQATYTLTIGPTSSEWVRLYAAPEGRGVSNPPLGGSCAVPSAATCAAGATPVPIHAPPLSSISPPAVQEGVTYGIRMSSGADAREGVVSFVAPRSGSYQFALGSPHFPLQVREEGRASSLNADCYSRVPDAAACSDFKATRSYRLKAGVRYRIELEGVDSADWLRLSIHLEDVPPELPTTDGLALWLRADRGVEPRAGGLLWRDQSDLHRDATAPSFAESPALVDSGINELATLRFDGLDDVLTFDPIVTMDATLFWVAKSNWAVAGEYDFQSVLGAATFTNSYIGYRDTYLLDVLESSEFYKDLLQPHLVAAMKTGSQAIIFPRFKYAFPGTTEYSRIGQHGPNKWSNLNSDFSEVIIYTRALTASERGATEAYLRGRYALSP